LAAKDKNYGPAFNQLGREMSGYTVMFHQLVAERIGLSVTDFKCFDIASRIGPVTAGQLSEYTGLTTGAITGVIDRLEKAGFVTRQQDPNDRRKVMIAAVADRMPDSGKLFQSLAQSMSALISSYSAENAEMLLEFMQRVVDVMRQETQKLRMLNHEQPAVRR
jgi:DNA-binding MarR family transcriptional regulator